jgi:hypothetical protein
VLNTRNRGVEFQFDRADLDCPPCINIKDRIKALRKQISQKKYLGRKIGKREAHLETENKNNESLYEQIKDAEFVADFFNSTSEDDDPTIKILTSILKVTGLKIKVAAH